MNVDSIILIGIAVICGVLLLVSYLKKRWELFFSFLLRMVTGMVGILLLNWIVTMKGYTAIVGINGGTILTLGVLGAPGFILLYSLSFYFMWSA